jgi:hypothetical protein
MNQIQLIPPATQGSFDYSILDSELAEQAQAAAGRIKDRLQTTRRSYIDIGNDLIEMKEKLGHGRFGPWLETEFTMSVRFADDCMASARLVTKFAVGANLPPTILVALASPSADPGIIEDVLADFKVGKVVTAADVKEKLAEARTAKKKAQAAQKKSPEQIAKERAAEKRRQAAQEKTDREHKEMWAERHALEAEAAKEFARGLVVGLGAGGALKLITSAPNMSLHQVKQQFQHPIVDGRNTFLTEQEIEKKFGGAP